MNCPNCGVFTSSKKSCTSCGEKLPQDKEQPAPNPTMPTPPVAPGFAKSPYHPPHSETYLRWT